MALRLAEAPTAAASPAAELHALTGLRSVAAASVVALHLWGKAGTGTPIGSLVHAGNLGVDLFFVLSGFVLAYRYADALRRPAPRSVAAFLKRRIARVYPLHLAMIAVLGAGMLAATLVGASVPAAERNSPGDLVANLLLVQAWGTSQRQTWNQVAWSVSAEWAAYLAFAVLIWAAPRATRPAA